MKHCKTILALTLVVIIYSSCKQTLAEKEINFQQLFDHTFSDFNIQQASFIVTQQGTVKASDYGDDDRSGFINNAQPIIHQFSDPITLDYLIKDSMIGGDSALDKYFPTVRNWTIRVKDLVIVPADNWDPLRFRADSVSRMTAVMLDSANKWKKQTIKPLNFSPEKRPVRSVRSLFEQLAAVSNFFDTSYTEYAFLQDSLVTNLFPTWYTENKTIFYGWKVLKYQKNTILWNCFTNKDEVLLVLKFMDKNIFTAITYRSANVPTPYSYNREDLLQSPIALALIRSVLLPQDYQHEIDYKGEWAAIAKKIGATDNSPYKAIYSKDLIAHARYYEALGDVNNARKLYAGYGSIIHDTLLAKYVNQTPVAEIDHISDNLNTCAVFNIEKEGYYQLFAGGQVLPVSDYKTAPYQSDNVQIILTPKNNKSASPIKVFHFNYRFNKIAGMPDGRHDENWLTDSQTQFAFSDPSDTSYILEVAIPWNEINGSNKAVPLLSNILIGDSDYEENKRESVLSWAIPGGKDWLDVSSFGPLPNKPVNKKIIIDGKIDADWNTTRYSPIELPYFDRVNSSDNSAQFKTLYSTDYLYFLFEITDNCKNKTGIITKDKCWIENASNGQLIWKLPADTSAYSPSCSTEKKLYLKAGNYNLRYSSDKGYSFEGWYGNPPYNDLYGGFIYKIIN